MGTLLRQHAAAVTAVPWQLLQLADTATPGRFKVRPGCAAATCGGCVRVGCSVRVVGACGALVVVVPVLWQFE